MTTPQSQSVEEIIQKLPQAILGAMEYRGFSDCEKYLDETLLEAIKPIIMDVLHSHTQGVVKELEALMKVDIGDASPTRLAIQARLDALTKLLSNPTHHE